MYGNFNYTARKAWKALHFTMRIAKQRNSNTKSLAYTSLVRPILEHGAACWDPFREGQINELGRGCKINWQNLQILRTNRIGKRWRSVER